MAGFKSITPELELENGKWQAGFQCGEEAPVVMEMSANDCAKIVFAMSYRRVPESYESAGTTSSCSSRSAWRATTGTS
jgi:hypothetical protein